MKPLPGKNEVRMKVYYGLALGFFIGTFFGMFLLGLVQMLGKGDQRNEKLILERRGKIGSGQFCQPDDYHSYFMPNRRGRIRSVSGGKFGKAGHPDNRVLHDEHGHLEL
jgi:hypothetical protein